MAQEKADGGPVTGPVGPAVEFDTTVAHPARVYDYWLLRHEALWYRAGVRDLRRQAVAAA